MIYIGADHRGFELKEQIKLWLSDNGYEVEDVGAYLLDPEDDYVDPAVKVASNVEGSDSDKGILLCGSGHGMDVLANKFHNVRAVIGFNEEVTVQGRQDEDANILVIPADWVGGEEANERVRLFLETEKSEATRHERRRQKITDVRIR